MIRYIFFLRGQKSILVLTEGQLLDEMPAATLKCKEQNLKRRGRKGTSGFQSEHPINTLQENGTRAPSKQPLQQQ